MLSVVALSVFLQGSFRSLLFEVTSINTRRERVQGMPGEGREVSNRSNRLFNFVCVTASE